MRSEEILKCICFVILGYFIAMIFNRMCSCRNINGFNVGGVVRCETCNAPDQVGTRGDCDEGLFCIRESSYENFNALCPHTGYDPAQHYCLSNSTNVGNDGEGNEEDDDGDGTDVGEDMEETDEEEASFGGPAPTMGAAFPQNFGQAQAQV